jgi:prevent-host-death family protein
VKQVNVQEAKTHLSRLVEEVQQGAEIIIGKAGKPMAKLVKFQPKKPARRALGCLKGSFHIAEDAFSEKVDEGIAREMTEGGIFPESGDDSNHAPSS